MDELQHSEPNSSFSAEKLQVTTDFERDLTSLGDPSPTTINQKGRLQNYEVLQQPLLICPVFAFELKFPYDSKNNRTKIIRKQPLFSLSENFVRYPVPTCFATASSVSETPYPTLHRDAPASDIFLHPSCRYLHPYGPSLFHPPRNKRFQHIARHHRRKSANQRTRPQKQSTGQRSGFNIPFEIPSERYRILSRTSMSQSLTTIEKPNPFRPAALLRPITRNGIFTS